MRMLFSRDCYSLVYRSASLFRCISGNNVQEPTLITQVSVKQIVICNQILLHKFICPQRFFVHILFEVSVVVVGDFVVVE